MIILKQLVAPSVGVPSIKKKERKIRRVVRPVAAVLRRDALEDVLDVELGGFVTPVTPNVNMVSSKKQKEKFPGRSGPSPSLLAEILWKMSLIYGHATSSPPGIIEGP